MEDIKELINKRNYISKTGMEYCYIFIAFMLLSGLALLLNFKIVSAILAVPMYVALASCTYYGIRLHLIENKIEKRQKDE